EVLAVPRLPGAACGKTFPRFTALRPIARIAAESRAIVCTIGCNTPAVPVGYPVTLVRACPGPLAETLQPRAVVVRPRTAVTRAPVITVAMMIVRPVAVAVGVEPVVDGDARTSVPVPEVLAAVVRMAPVAV